jgi:hypothetical protein
MDFNRSKSMSVKSLDSVGISGKMPILTRVMIRLSDGSVIVYLRIMDIK